MTKVTLSITFLMLTVMVLGLLGTGTVDVAAETFPEVIPLPDGFRPEGIAVGNGTDFYVGSLRDGSIYKGNLRTGEGDFLVDKRADDQPEPAVGLSFDRRGNRLFVAGGGSGKAFVYDADSGDLIKEYQLTKAEQTFVNDAVVTRQAVYFTDSFRSFLYRLPLGNNGALPDEKGKELPLEGFVSGAGFNANGIDASADGKTLVMVKSSTGELFRVDPEPDKAVATLIDLGGGSVPNGDGILLDGKILYVVQNQNNKIAVVQLSPDLSSGEIERVIENPNFRVPTTIAEFGEALYAVNARFDTPPAPDTEYEAVRVSKH